jgi:hypothetical protein
MIDQLPHDQIPILEHATGVVLGRVALIDAYGIIRPNHLFPPFDNPKARQALAFTVDQRAYASAAFGDERWWRECWSFFVCGSANGTEAGAEPYRKQDAALWWSALQQNAINRERIVALGRRSARGRVAYLLCELVWRQRAVGLAKDHAIRLPLTQIELASDAGRTRKGDMPS